MAFTWRGFLVITAPVCCLPTLCWHASWKEGSRRHASGAFWTSGPSVIRKTLFLSYVPIRGKGFALGSFFSNAVARWQPGVVLIQDCIACYLCSLKNRQKRLMLRRFCNISPRYTSRPLFESPAKQMKPGVVNETLWGLTLIRSSGSKYFVTRPI